MVVIAVLHKSVCRGNFEKLARNFCGKFCAEKRRHGAVFLEGRWEDSLVPVKFADQSVTMLSQMSDRRSVLRWTSLFTSNEHQSELCLQRTTPCCQKLKLYNS